MTDTPLRRLLDPGERIIWEAQPEVGPFSMRGAIFLIPFSVLWAGFAIFWEVTAIIHGAGWFFALWGIPFVVIGLYMVFGRILVARREAASTFYAITDRRILIQRGGFGSSRTELELRDLPVFQVEAGKNGLGSISFGPVLGFARMPPGWPTFGAYQQAPAFQAIRDVDRVAGIVREARDSARAEARASG